jgi:hypothetical protein
MREAKDSSEIENVFTTHDELYREDADPDEIIHPAKKEVYRYRHALKVGFDLVQSTGLITVNHLCQIQSKLLENEVGIRTLPGTHLRNS